MGYTILPDRELPPELKRLNEYAYEQGNRYIDIPLKIYESRYVDGKFSDWIKLAEQFLESDKIEKVDQYQLLNETKLNYLIGWMEVRLWEMGNCRKQLQPHFSCIPENESSKQNRFIYNKPGELSINSAKNFQGKWFKRWSKNDRFPFPHPCIQDNSPTWLIFVVPKLMEKYYGDYAKNTINRGREVGGERRIGDERRTGHDRGTGFVERRCGSERRVYKGHIDDVLGKLSILTITRVKIPKNAAIANFITWAEFYDALIKRNSTFMGCGQEDSRNEKTQQSSNAMAYYDELIDAATRDSTVITSEIKTLIEKIATKTGFDGLSESEKSRLQTFATNSPKTCLEVRKAQLAFRSVQIVKLLYERVMNRGKDFQQIQKVVGKLFRFPGDLANKLCEAFHAAFEQMVNVYEPGRVMADDAKPKNHYIGVNYLLNRTFLGPDDFSFMDLGKVYDIAVDRGWQYTWIFSDADFNFDDTFHGPVEIDSEGIKLDQPEGATFVSFFIGPKESVEKIVNENDFSALDDNEKLIWIIYGPRQAQ